MNQNYVEDPTGQLTGRPQLLTQSQQLLQTGQLPNQVYYPDNGGFIMPNQIPIQHPNQTSIPNQISNAVQQAKNQNSLTAWLAKYWWLILALALILIALLIWWYCNKKSNKSIGGDTVDIATGAPTKLKITKSRIGPLYD